MNPNPLPNDAVDTAGFSPTACLGLRGLRAFVVQSAALLVPLLASLGTARALDLYVAPPGKTAASNSPLGAQENPFPSLEAARDAIRRQKTEGGFSKDGLTVWIAAGHYPRTNAFTLTAADSGTAAAPILWRGRPGETPRLVGGRLLSGFRAVSDAAVARRFPEIARAHVRECDLRALGITDFGEMKSRGFSRATVPAHCELFVAGQPMVLARWPNEGAFERIAGFPPSSGENDGHGGNIGKVEAGFQYTGDRPRGWKPSGEIWVHGYWSWDWANSYERIEALDLEKRLIKTAAPHGLYGFRKDQRFYFLNVLEELDQPGEWYLDREAGRLYFWPPDEASLSQALLSLSAEPLLDLRDVSHVTFQGLVLEGTRASGVTIRGGSSNRIASCLIRAVGNHGIDVAGGSGHSVVGCDVFDTGDGGVALSGGDRRTLTPAGHFVENCHFQRQGRWSKCYVPAILLQGVGLRASHNLIHDHPHCAILYWGNEHLMEFNEIHHIALETGDVGAIYTGRDYTFRGNRIRNNYIHHTGGVGMGSMGVYMDDCVSGTEIEGNIFFKVERAAFLGGGRDHRVVNNVFVDCNHAVELDGRGLDRSPVWRGMVDQTMRNQLKDIPLALYRERYPALRGLDAYYGAPGETPLTGEAFKGVPPGNNLVARNVVVGKWLRVGWHAQQEPGMLQLENNFVGDAPGFVHGPLTEQARPADFDLVDDSPARRSGFQALPTERMGLRPEDAARREIPAVSQP